jgi:hypothetical protein
MALADPARTEKAARMNLSAEYGVARARRLSIAKKNLSEKN